MNLEKGGLKCKCNNPLCDFEFPEPEDKLIIKHLDKYTSPSFIEFTRQDILRGAPGFFPTAPFELDEGERKVMFWGSFTISSAIIIGFLWVSCIVLEIPWQTFQFGFLFWGFIISRVVDILTTLLGLGFGLAETNPFSDPYNISRLLKLHVPHMVIVLILAYFLGKWTPLAGNGFLLWMSMMGFRAGLSNITQFLHIFKMSIGESKVPFYVNAVFCSVVICGVAYFAIPYFLNHGF
jgi:hypothetical protein